MNPITFYFPKQESRKRKTEEQEGPILKKSKIVLSSWHLFPNEIFVQIFSYLHLMDLIHLRGVFLWSRSLKVVRNRMEKGSRIENERVFIEECSVIHRDKGDTQIFIRGKLK